MKSTGVVLLMLCHVAAAAARPPQEVSVLAQANSDRDSAAGSDADDAAAGAEGADAETEDVEVEDVEGEDEESEDEDDKVKDEEGEGEEEAGEDEEGEDEDDEVEDEEVEDAEGEEEDDDEEGEDEEDESDESNAAATVASERTLALAAATVASARPPLCDGRALPERRPVDFFADFFFGDEGLPKLTSREVQKLYTKYRRPFAPERREAGGIRYWSCDVAVKRGGQPFKGLAAPASYIAEQRDCDVLPWLTQFLPGGSWRSFDIGASDGECSLGLLAVGHKVTLVDHAFSEQAWRTWVRMSLDANGWRDRAEFVNAVADGSDMEMTRGAPTLDELTGRHDQSSLGIVKLDVNSGSKSREFGVLRSGGQTLRRAALLQIENDSPETGRKLLSLLCAAGMQPYALKPDLKKEPVPPSLYELYFNVRRPECQRLAERRFESACRGEACEGRSTFSKQTAHFVMEPLCVCGALTGRRGWRERRAADCAYQIAAVQMRGFAFAAIRDRFGAC